MKPGLFGLNVTKQNPSERKHQLPVLCKILNQIEILPAYFPDDTGMNIIVTNLSMRQYVGNLLYIVNV